MTPAADSYTDASNPTSNFGTSTQVRLDGSPVVRTFLRFNVSGISGTVTGATLRMWANTAQSTGYDAFSVANNTWGETTITDATAPPFGAKLGSSGKITAGTWTSVSVTPFITGNGTYSFGISTTNATALSLSSREGANPPQLVIGVNGGAAQIVPPLPSIPPGPSLPGAIAPLLVLLWPILLFWSLRWAPMPKYAAPRGGRRTAVGSMAWTARAPRAYRR